MGVLLLVSYETFPPPALDAAQVAAEVAEVRRTASMSTAVIRASRAGADASPSR